MIDGHSCHGFSFTLENQNHETGKADVIVYPPFKESIRVSTPHLRVASKLDISPRMPWMTSEEVTFVRSPVHRALNHTLPTVPIVGLEEAVAEKLARYSRDPILRDLYDLWWYGSNVQLNETLIRTTWIKKVYLDFVIERRWKSRVFEPTLVLSKENLKSLRREQIGLYHDDADIASWDREFRTRYSFLLQLSDEDLTWAKCDPRDRYEFLKHLNLKDSYENY